MASEVAGALREVSNYEEGKSVASTVSPVGFSLLGFLLPNLCCMPPLASLVAIPLCLLSKHGGIGAHAKTEI